MKRFDLKQFIQLDLISTHVTFYSINDLYFILSYFPEFIPFFGRMYGKIFTKIIKKRGITIKLLFLAKYMYLSKITKNVIKLSKMKPNLDFSRIIQKYPLNRFKNYKIERRIMKEYYDIIKKKMDKSLSRSRIEWLMRNNLLYRKKEIKFFSKNL